MKVFQKTVLFVFASMLFLTSMLIATASLVAAQKLIWEADVLATGEEVIGPYLGYGKHYRIVATEMFLYNVTANLAADAQYYTKDPFDPWVWGDYYYYGHSFLQINGEDVDWGPFSNGEWGPPPTGHTYTIDYIGAGAAITFKIVDWIDDDYDNNESHLPVKIYEIPVVGGYIVDSTPLKIIASWIISAIMMAVLITVPFIKYCRKTRRIS